MSNTPERDNRNNKGCLSVLLVLLLGKQLNDVGEVFENYPGLREDAETLADEITGKRDVGDYIHRASTGTTRANDNDTKKPPEDNT